MQKRNYVKKIHEGMFKVKEPNTQYGSIQNHSIVPEEITYRKLNTQNKRNTISSKNIRISAHAKQVASERLGIFSDKELQKLSANAKRNGLNMSLLNMMNYTDYELSFEHYKWLKDKYYCTNNEAVFFYKGFFYIFTGKHNHTLKTIIYPGLPITAEKPSSGDDIIDAFFADIHETQFHNINCNRFKGRNSMRTKI